MPRVRIVLYRDKGGGVPFLDWFGSLPPRARAKLRVLLGRLAELGHELRRPAAEYLGEGLYELRVKELRVNYRVLYFFHQRWTAVLSHGLAKQTSAVPEREIQLALRRKLAFEADPEHHTLREEPWR